ncbi:MAG TPA: LysR family transcriptional regulator [Alphaproteobacteria bacterium]|nr:LysR family transcriptional regulator [Alphaproteobacteria bacterium]
MARLTLRVDFGPERQIGPGKIRLLEKIGETGSISAAGRAMGMSYRRAWLLVDALNRSFTATVVTTQLGGKAGGGAGLTPFGALLVGHYRAMEGEAARAVASRLGEIEALLAPAMAPSVASKPPGAKSKKRQTKRAKPKRARR